MDDGERGKEDSVIGSVIPWLEKKNRPTQRCENTKYRQTDKG